MSRYNDSPLPKDDDLAGVILTWFLQVVGLAAAIAFGVFSILSWTTAQDAKQQANTANQQATAANLLALAALCGNSIDQVPSSLSGC